MHLSIRRCVLCLNKLSLFTPNLAFSISSSYGVLLVIASSEYAITNTCHEEDGKDLKVSQIDWVSQQVVSVDIIDDGDHAMGSID